MPKVLCLYVDDSGTRNPDQLPTEFNFGDWFTLGGFVINEEDEYILRDAHSKFCANWQITYPLRSFDIRQMVKRFAWIAKLEPAEYNRLMRELTDLMVGLPITGHGCVIDRPGYDARYRQKYGRQTWMLCRTAFAVVCERAAKLARTSNRKLRVYVEEGDKTADDHIRSYYSELRTKGMPFDASPSAKYQPLSAIELRETLYDLDFKNKSSPMAQIADLYLYPIARGGYQPAYAPYVLLQKKRKLIDAHLEAESIPHLGIKYSCFELANAAQVKASRRLQNKKSRG
jgi:hypothetical protein